MGCDIHCFAEKRTNGKWEQVTDHFTLSEDDKRFYEKEKGDCPFDWRSYSMYAFLADVRNYDHCEPISQPKGLPQDMSDGVRRHYELWRGNAHSASYLTVRELLDFDYDKVFWNRRVSKQIAPNIWSGAEIAEEGEGEGKMMTYRDNLGKDYFDDLGQLQQIGDPDDVRIVFWFDN